MSGARPHSAKVSGRRGTRYAPGRVNVEQKVATLEALLVRVKRNAAEARPERALYVFANDDAAHASALEDATTELPPELAHAVLPAPASSRTPVVAEPAQSPRPPPVESPKPPLAESPKPPSIEPEPESKPRLVALAPPLATASRALRRERSRRPTASPAATRSGQAFTGARVAEAFAGDRVAEAGRGATDHAADAVGRREAADAGGDRQARGVTGPARAAHRRAGRQGRRAGRSREGDGEPRSGHERSGAKTLMGTGLDEMRKALAQLDSKAPAPPTSPSAQPAMLGAEKISDDTTGEGATLVRSSPFDASVAAHAAMAKQSLVEEASTEDEQTVLIPQPTQEELIAASERGGRTTRRQLREPAALEDESGEGDTLVKESPFAAAASEREPEPPTLAKPQTTGGPKLGAMGTMMMPTSPSAPAMGSPPAPPPPDAPAPAASSSALGGTAIMEHALAATVPSESPAAPPPPEMAESDARADGDAAARHAAGERARCRPVGARGAAVVLARRAGLRGADPRPEEKESRADLRRRDRGRGIGRGRSVALASQWLDRRADRRSDERKAHAHGERGAHDDGQGGAERRADVRRVGEPGARARDGRADRERRADGERCAGRERQGRGERCALRVAFGEARSRRREHASRGGRAS